MLNVIERCCLSVRTLSMALPTFDTLPWMSLCREASICTVSLIFLQHCAIVWDRTVKSASCTPARQKREVFTVHANGNIMKPRNLFITDGEIKLKFHFMFIGFSLPNATSCPRISQTLRRSSSSLSSDWWPYITKRWSTFSSSRSTHAHCSMVQTGTLTHTHNNT